MTSAQFPTANLANPSLLTVQATNPITQQSNQATVTIYVESTPAPYVMSPLITAQTFIIPKNPTVGTIVGTVSVYNPSHVPLVFSIASGSIITINSTTGLMTLSKAPTNAISQVPVIVNGNTTPITILAPTLLKSTTSVIVWAMIAVLGLIGIAALTLGVLALLRKLKASPPSLPNLKVQEPEKTPPVSKPPPKDPILF